MVQRHEHEVSLIRCRSGCVWYAQLIRYPTHALFYFAPGYPGVNFHRLGCHLQLLVLFAYTLVDHVYCIHVFVLHKIIIRSALLPHKHVPTILVYETL